MPDRPEPDQMSAPERGRRKLSAPTLRHAYVAVAAILAVVALVAAAVNGSSNTGSGQSAAPKGKRAAEYYKRLRTIGRGLIATPIGVGELPKLPAGISTLTDGTHFKLSLDKPSRVTFVKVTIVPGASIPWHHHSGPFLIELISGEVIDYRPNRPHCAGKALKAGHVVFEPNTQIHTLANPFKVPAVFYVVAWSPAKLQPTLIQLKPPPGCPASLK
jgi:quercetin dioxygenase-like cupin family protein